MQGRQRRPEPHSATRQKDVLDRGKERLVLRLAPTRPAGHEQVHRGLVEMIGQMQCRPDVSAPRLWKCWIFGRLECGRNVGMEGALVALGNPRTTVGLGHRDEEPRLSIAAARREGARLAHGTDQRRRNRIGLEPADRSRRANALEEGDPLASLILLPYVIHDTGV